MNKKRFLRAGVLCLMLAAPLLSPAQKQAAVPQCESYLFAFFSDNTPYGEQIRYALSDDGFNYRALNDGRPVVASDSISRKRSIRDPHILRAQDGKTFYMVLTDMRSSQGWQSNDGLVLMKSTDLLHWEHTAIHFPERFPNLEGFDEKNLHAVWAPQTIWDEAAQKYMIYYSIGRHDWEYPTDDPNFKQPYFKIFYSYANEDFTDITEPQLLFDFGTASIDGDIVYDRKNGEYVLFFKDEGRPVMNPKGNFRTRQGVMRATSKSLTGPYTVEYRHLQKPGQYPVEGSSVFPLIHSDEYILMYDCYANGHYQFCKSADLKNFVYIQDTPTRGNFTPRHGSVMHITREECERLEAWDDLCLALDELRRIPVPAFTLAELADRKEVMDAAKRTLATESDADAFARVAKKVRKFAGKF
ncbi:MAG: glycoside hydrolase family 43 protein [Bacteroidaceae bacterium]|nr:glycoside hydrolase family 43 protein [Bacteroidaceae bacterium]